MFALLIILGIFLGVIVAAIAIYNRLIRLRNTVKSSWSDIDVQCKKRYDLVPNLVETVKSYATHERALFEKVTEARTMALRASSPANKSKAFLPLPRHTLTSRQVQISCSSRHSSKN
jgi:LemA protein